MQRLRQTAFAVTAAAVLLGAPAAAVAAGPGLAFLPFVLGRHVIGAAVRLATLPLAVASAALSNDEPPPPYSQSPGYSYNRAPPNYYQPPYYRPSPPTYYARPLGYYPAPYAYQHRTPYYAPARGYYSPGVRNSTYYGSHGPNRSGGSTYRRR
jgi:hypothetical protein